MDINSVNKDFPSQKPISLKKHPSANIEGIQVSIHLPVAINPSQPSPSINASVISVENDSTSTTIKKLAAHSNIVPVIDAKMNAGANLEAAANDMTALMHAVQEGNEEVVLSLMKSGVDLEARDKHGNTALMFAAKYGHWDILWDLIGVFRSYSNLEATNNLGETALMIAAKEGHSEIVQALTDSGAQVDKINKQGETALMMAAEKGDYQSVIILANLAKIETKNTKGETALMLAAAKGHHQSVKILAKFATSQIDIKNIEGETALMIAAKHGHIRSIEGLILAGANPEARNNRDLTPLMVATLTGHKEIVEALIKAGVNIEATTNNGPLENALMLAALTGRKEIIKLLINEIVNSETKTSSVLKALGYAILAGNKEIMQQLKQFTGIEFINEEDNRGCIEVLIDAGANINTMETRILIDLIRKSDKEVVQTLLKIGLNSNAVNNALINAVKMGDIEVVNKIITACPGLESTCQDSNRNTVLMLAIKERHEEMVSVLLNAGARPKRVGNNELTTAVKTGSLEMVKQLLSAWPDLDFSRKDNDGNTALMLALKECHFNIVRTLFKAGATLEKEVANEALITIEKLGSVEIVKELIAACPDLEFTCQDSNGNTALMLAVLSRNIPMMQELARAGSNLNTKNLNGDSPLALAMNQNDELMVQELIKFGANINLGVNKYDEAPLMYALKRKKMNLVEILMRNENLNVNFESKFNKSCVLDAAINMGDTKIVRALIARGADPNRHNLSGMSPLMNAIEQDKTEMIELLIELGGDQHVATESFKRKLLAHLWGIKGESQLIDRNGITREIRLESMRANYPRRILLEYADIFFNTKRINRFISDDDLDKIKTCIKNSLDNEFRTKIDSKTITDIQLGNPCIIFGGFHAHRVSIVICKNELIIFNRGLGRKANAAERFDLPAGQVTQELLQKFTKYSPDSDKDSFDEMIKSLGLSYKGGFVQKDQKVGNCCWAGAKGALGILCRAYADPNWGQENEGSNDTAESGRKIYKEFTAFARNQVLAKYLSSSPKEMQDTELLLEIKKKCEIKGLIISKTLLQNLKTPDEDHDSLDAL